VPGHSAGDIVFHDPARRFAFSGDHIIKGMSPNPLMRKPAPGETHSNSLVQYQQSLARTRALDIETCHPGHGSAFNNHIEVIDNILERHDRRTREIGDLLTKGPGTPYNFVMQIFPKLEYRMLHFGLSLVVGHLEILLKRGETEMRDDNGILIWSLTGNSC
jgi:glyoxylase-like metal-dependent hydrolase (beta-lactamase superfamily II)